MEANWMAFLLCILGTPKGNTRDYPDPDQSIRYIMTGKRWGEVDFVSSAPEANIEDEFSVPEGVQMAMDL